MVSTEENKRLVRRFYEDVVNTGNVDELDGLISTDYVEVYNNTKYPIGIDGAKEHVWRPQNVPRSSLDDRATDCGR